MKLAVGAVIVAMTAACGGSSGGGQLVADPTPSAAATPTASPAFSPLMTELSASDLPSIQATAAAVSARPVPAGSATAAPAKTTSPSSPTPRPKPTVTPGTADTITVDDNDNGRSIQLAVGQRLRVRLNNGTWDPPDSSAQAVVVRRSSAGGYPTDQPVDATFEAVGRGDANVTTQSDAACFHTEPRCAMPTRQWQVQIVVR
jgi:hypothetical protein